MPRLVSAPGIESSSTDVLRRALATALTDSDPPIPPVLLVRHCDWSGERELSEQVGPAYIRVGMDGDRVWIGPGIQRSKGGADVSFEERLRLNHPRREEWANLFATEQPSRAKTMALTTPMADVIAQLVLDISHNSKFPSFFVVQFPDAIIERHNFIADPDVSAAAVLPADDAKTAAMHFQSRWKNDPRGYRLPNPALTPRTAAQLVDRRAGLVKHLFQDVQAQLMPMAVAESSLPGERLPSTTYGRGPTIAGSRMVAILEAAERFSGTRPRGRYMHVRASFAELKEAAIRPQAFLLHAPDQCYEPGYALVPYSDNLEQDWVWACSLRQRQPVLVPAQLCYYGIADRPGRPVNRYVYETSSGCALGSCFEEAILHALFEVIERDAYMTGWYGRFPYPPIDCSAVGNATIDGLLLRARAEGYNVHLFDMTLEFGVPSIWSMIEDPRPGAPVRSYCAAAAHLDPEQAVVSALVEAISSMSVYRTSMPASIKRARELVENPERVQSMEDHVLLFSQPETMAWLDFLPRHARPVPIAERFPNWYRKVPDRDLTVDLENVVAAVLKVAEDVIVVDQSFSTLQSLSLKAVRVNAPGLHPISFGHQYRRVSLARVQKAADYLQLGRSYSAEMLNPHPHNFP